MPLVRCGEIYALSPGPLLPNTSWIAPLRLVPHPEGLLVAFGEPLDRYFPSPDSLEDAIAREVRSPRFGGEMARERRGWLDAMGLREFIGGSGFEY